MRGGCGGGRGLRSGESTAAVGALAGGVEGCTVRCGGGASAESRGADGAGWVGEVEAPCSTSSSEWLLCG